MMSDVNELIPSVIGISEALNYNPEDLAGRNSNVSDKYKGMTVEAIRLDLDNNRSKMVNVCVNTGSDFNLSSVIRSGNGFACGATIIAGRRKWDRRGAVGTHHYEHVFLSPDVFKVIEKLKDDGYSVFPVDNTPEFHPVSIYRMNFPEKSAFLYGEESNGLSMDVVQACENNSVYIPQYGSVRSLNVACAATVLMYEYNRQWMVE